PISLLDSLADLLDHFLAAFDILRGVPHIDPTGFEMRMKLLRERLVLVIKADEDRRTPRVNQRLRSAIRCGTSGGRSNRPGLVRRQRQRCWPASYQKEIRRIDHRCNFEPRDILARQTL